VHLSVQEDREEFAISGLSGVVMRLMAEAGEGFVRILSDGWRGERVASRPDAGSGPYIHYRLGFPLMKHFNEAPDDDRAEEFRLPKVW
jgi:hypothetical protein